MERADARGGRRRTLLAAGALAAAGTGVGLALWRERATREDDPVWSLVFERPDGSRLALSALRGQPLLLNFWATWCPPCVREMPLLDRFAREQRVRGWRVVGLAADQAAPVREFLARSPVDYDIALAGFAAIELSRRLGNNSGGLPFSVAFGRDGGLRSRHVGELRAEHLAAWAEGYS